ncbi:hypothetical protein D9757_001473 [Collybiopsis confluens]|uniref:Uncharacterized protein n=1 Tax=Collybiopsis confluens TaxID=2823264 RepID=A0A8H5HZ97_9AGAR|nr:hypothetical protein D9757_013988 [Collybiopsis confluens]KAF5392238.1 hypothetical protein D9757_001473 [Collybiopsis confluens]
MSQLNSSVKPWPLSVARSTGSENQDLLHALLCSSAIDEISDVDDYDAVRSYATHQGLKADESGKIAIGLIFWVYPTTLHGPYHENERRGIEKHGVLLTVESGASVDEVVKRVKDGVRPNEIVHVHICA